MAPASPFETISVCYLLTAFAIIKPFVVQLIGGRVQ